MDSGKMLGGKATTADPLVKARIRGTKKWLASPHRSKTLHPWWNVEYRFDLPKDTLPDAALELVVEDQRVAHVHACKRRLTASHSRRALPFLN